MSYAPGVNGIALFEENTPTTFIIGGEDTGSDAPDISAVERMSGRGTLKRIADNFDWTFAYDNDSIQA